MNELIEIWKKNFARKQDSIFDFLTRLKWHRNPDIMDKIARKTHADVFSQIDCTKCANCCKKISPYLNKSDITRISASLEISEEEFIKKYLKIGDDNEYEMNELPCPFLKDDKCSIFEVRPKNCLEYPYTDKKGFTQRRYMHTENTDICPPSFTSSNG